MDNDTTDTLRRLAVDWFRTIDDAGQTHEVRLIACSAIGWVLNFIEDDAGLLDDVLAVVRRAVDRGDRSPMLLLFEAGPTIHRNANFATDVMRLGEHALGRGNTYALARITIALGRRTDFFLRCGKSPDPLRAPPEWIRALVGSGPVEDLEGDVRDAVRLWLRDKGSDLAAVADVIPDPETWGDLEEGPPSADAATTQMDAGRRRVHYQGTGRRLLLNLRAASGRHCGVEALHLSETYGGMLCGLPSKEANAGIIERLKTKAARMWSERPVFVVPPQVHVEIMPECRSVPWLTESMRTAHVLPPLECIAWLTSEPLRSDDAGSELVVAWFSDVISGDLQAWVQAGLHDVPWEQYARDCSL